MGRQEDPPHRVLVARERQGMSMLSQGRRQGEHLQVGRHQVGRSRPAHQHQGLHSRVGSLSGPREGMVQGKQRRRGGLCQSPHSLVERQVAGLKVIHYNTRAAGRPLLHHRGSAPVGGSLCMRVSGATLRVSETRRRCCRLCAASLRARERGAPCGNPRRPLN